MEGQRILVATDLSDNAEPAARVGAEMADWFDLETELIHIFDMTGYDGDKQFRIFKDPDRREKAEHRAVEWFREVTGGAPDAVTLDAGEPAAGIRERAVDEDVACLVIAMSGRGAWSRIIFGSTALKVCGRPPTLTAVAHPKFHRLREEMAIGVGTDFSEPSSRALREAVWMARTFDASLRIVHCSPLPSRTVIREGELPPGMKRTEVVESARRSMDEFTTRHEELLEGLDWETDIISDHPVAGLREFVEEYGIEWLVLGHRRPEERAGQQTVKGKWVQQMNCSTMLVPRERSK